MCGVIGNPNATLGAVLSMEVMKALRGGIALEDCIATLIAQAETLQIALPVAGAVFDSHRSPI